MNRSRWIWISWEYHRRSENLVRELGIESYVLTSQRPRWQRHPMFLFQSAMILFRERPEALFVQNPSWFLTLLAIFLRPILGFTLIVDAHNAGVYPFEPAHEKYQKIFPVFHSKADLTIVTNQVCAEIVAGHGGRPVILPDALPDLDPPESCPALGDGVHITFICTYASDEPYAEVMAAAADFPAGITLWITGNENRCPDELRNSAPSCVKFTGFLPEEDFVAHLAASDALMDLTTFDDCLVCGAYEGTSLEVPLILSDSPVNRAYFRRGVAYTGNDRTSIARTIGEVVQQLPFMKEEIGELRALLAKEWRSSFDDLLRMIGDAKAASD